MSFFLFFFGFEPIELEENVEPLLLLRSSSTKERAKDQRSTTKSVEYVLYDVMQETKMKGKSWIEIANPSLLFNNRRSAISKRGEQLAKTTRTADHQEDPWIWIWDLCVDLMPLDEEEEEEEEREETSRPQRALSAMRGSLALWRISTTISTPVSRTHSLLTHIIIRVNPQGTTLPLDR